MSYIDGIVSGLIRGLGEIFPISGSGQKAIFDQLTGIGAEGQAFHTLLMAGLLLAVILVFRKAVLGMITGFISMIIGCFNGTFKWRKAGKYQIMAVYTVLGAIPGVAITLLQYFTGLGKSWEGNLLLTGIMLLLSGGLLYIGDHSICHNWKMQDMKPGHALKLGLFQAATIFPGLSRTAITLCMGRNMGFEKNTALEFSFMLSLPYFILAGAPGLNDLGGVPAVQWGVYAAGAAMAVIAGIGGLYLMKWLMKKDRFWIFMLYCLMAGVAAIVLNFVL